jgi:hypothetical protein
MARNFPSRIKEHQTIAVSYAHAQKDSSNTMKLLEIVETLDENECMIKALNKLIVTANGAISWLRNTHYLMILSAEDRLAIKNQTYAGFLRGNLKRGLKGKGLGGKEGGREKSGNIITCARKFCQGVVIFVV